jgi:hypothetical protein
MQVSIVAPVTQLTSLKVAAYHLLGDLGQLSALTRLHFLNLRVPGLKVRDDEGASEAALQIRPVQAGFRQGLGRCLAAWTQLQSLTITADLGRPELEALAQLQHLTQLGCCTLDIVAPPGGRTVPAGISRRSNSNMTGASSQRIRLGSLQVLRMLATTPATLAALDMPQLKEMTGLDMGRFEWIGRYPPITLYVFIDTSPSFIEAERLQLVQLASGHLQRCSSLCLESSAPPFRGPKASAVTAMLQVGELPEDCRHHCTQNPHVVMSNKYKQDLVVVRTTP